VRQEQQRATLREVDMRILCRRVAFAAVAAAFLASPASAATVHWTTGTGATGHWYELVSDTGKGWNDASAGAQARGGYLVSILSQEEQTFLISSLFNITPLAAYGSYWIGLNDAGNERGTSTAGWTWASSETYSYHYFATLSGQPDNNTSDQFGGTEGEDYVQIVWRPDGNYGRLGAWNDARQAGYEFATGTGLTHLNRKGYIVEYNSNPAPVPVPAALPLFGTLIAGLGLAAWRRGKAA
jgi:hypothetical protein